MNQGSSNLLGAFTVKVEDEQLVNIVGGVGNTSNPTGGGAGWRVNQKGGLSDVFGLPPGPQTNSRAKVNVLVPPVGPFKPAS